MDQLFNLLKGFAPAIATAVAGPLGGAAVSMIAKKFGVEDSVAAVGAASGSEAAVGAEAGSAADSAAGLAAGSAAPLLESAKCRLRIRSRFES